MLNLAFAQTNKDSLQSSLNSKQLKSLNNINDDLFYSIDCAFENSSLLGDMKGIPIIEKDLNDSLLIRMDSVALDSMSLELDSISLFEVDQSWKKSLNITIGRGDYLKGKYWLKISDSQKWSDFLDRSPRISTIDRQDEYVLVMIKDIMLDHLLELKFITYIEKVSESIKSEATVLDLNLHPNRINTIHAYLPEFDGSNELVSIKEPFYDYNDIDVSGRYRNTSKASEFSDTHALEMATIIAGNGNTSLNGLGVARQAFHTSTSNEEIMPNAIDYFTSNGIQVQNHSYGSELESFYGVAASLYDQQVYEEQQILHVFSIGNSGLEASDHGLYAGLAGFSNMTGNFKQAKNVLTVGAVDTSMNTIQLNSNGPAFDGRIKPEIVAYSMTGTSNSAALVSGVAVLLAQSFQRKYNSDISAALTKAVLINSADEIGALGPDHKTGYGSLNAYEAMEVLEEGHFINDQIISSQKKYKIKIPENAVNIKATLVWTDPPAEANDEIALVHDLNLQIKEANGAIHLPWLLSTEPNVNALNAPATKGVDHLNNIEQIYVDVIESDSIEIIVESNTPLNTNQSFSIAYGWEIKNAFSWTSPTFNDNVPYNGETTSHIRWESSFSNEQVGDLYFKLVSEDNWNLINQNVQLSDENFRWDPEIVNDFAQLKMEIDNQNYLSDTFSISAPLRLNVGYNCADSLSIYWKSIPDRDYYTVFHLKDNQMKPFISTQDTTINIKKSDLENSFLKVQAFKNGKELIEGRAIDYNLQSSNCFLKSYFVEAIQNEGIYHNLQLSSLSGVEKIQIEKRNEVDSKWVLLSEFELNDYELEFLEVDPDNGFNSSRAIIYFTNGESISSEVQSTYYVNSSDYIVYPIPLRRELDLKVFAKKAKSDAHITFYSAQGHEIFSTGIPSDRNFLDLSFLSPGVYIYKISTQAEDLATGKILMQQ